MAALTVLRMESWRTESVKSEILNLCPYYQLLYLSNLTPRIHFLHILADPRLRCPELNEEQARK